MLLMLSRKNELSGGEVNLSCQASLTCLLLRLTLGLSAAMLALLSDCIQRKPHISLAYI